MIFIISIIIFLYNYFITYSNISKFFQFINNNIKNKEKSNKEINRYKKKLKENFYLFYYYLHLIYVLLKKIKFI